MRVRVPLLTSFLCVLVICLGVVRALPWNFDAINPWASHTPSGAVAAPESVASESREESSANCTLAATDDSTVETTVAEPVRRKSTREQLKRQLKEKLRECLSSK
jgi:hypothetical protein